MFNPVFIGNETSSIKISADNATWQYIEKDTISGVTSVALWNVGSLQSTRTDRKNQLLVRIRLNDKSIIDFDIQDVQNQSTWTADQAGLNNATAMIQGWIG